MTRNSVRRLVVVIVAAAIPDAVVRAQVDTSSVAVPLSVAAVPPRAARMEASLVRRLPLMGIAAVSAATMTQAFGSPSGWPRTWSGYGKRLGDQAAFATIEEGTRLTLGATVNWVPDTVPCSGRVSSTGTIRLRAVLPRLGCAVRETVLLRTPEGRARPNFPFAVGAIGAAAASTLWRPDADTPAHALSLAATRVAVVFGATVVSHLISDWRQDRTR